MAITNLTTYHALACHPATPCPRVRAVETRVGAQPDGALTFGFVVAGDVARLRIPGPATPGSAGRLWEHTCFEAFAGREDAETYHEFNFSPSGQWAVYAFRRYRQPVALDVAAAPVVAARIAGDRLELDAVVPAALLPRPAARLRLALAAVIEDGDGALCYWALRHAPGRPDFHHPDAFALEIALPDELTAGARKTPC